MQVEQVTPRFGAVVTGVDADSPLPDHQVAEIKRLVVEYKVVFLPGQKLDNAEQVAFARQFGPPREDPLEECVDGHPGLATLDNVPYWHADWMQQPEPPSWSVLQMRTVPDSGGDTMFADLVSSYESLSPNLRGFLEGLTVTQELAPGFVEGMKAAYIARRAAEGPEYDDVIRRLQPTVHPLVRRIPETGRLNYWICELYSKRINELGPAESDAMLQFLFTHLLSPEYVIRWRWQPGDLAFWDQRATLHRGVRDYDPNVRRSGCRASLAPSTPIPARIA